MNAVTPTEANQLWCPMGRFEHMSTNCIADRCAMWRWARTTANREVIKTSPDGTKYRTYDLVEVKERGSCGLAGAVQ